MGSRVKETKSDTSTAKATVIPNWKKNRPTIPFIKATGTNTAMTDIVVASTASPISLVPSRAAVKWSSPRSKWRTMFSRTTMASSMSMPMAKDRAIRVSTFRVIPMKFITVKEEMTEMGRVRPVMTVERQEFRKQKTIRMVRKPPRTRVSSTSRTESRIMTEASRTISTRVPGGSSFWMTSISFFTRSTTPTVLAPDCLRIFIPREGMPFTKANDLCSSMPSRIWATSAKGIGRPPLRAITMVLNCSTASGFPETLSGYSVPPRFRRPSGVLTFSDCKPAITSSTPIPRASRRSGLISTFTSLLAGPTKSILPTPEMFSKRLLTFFSTSVVRSRGERFSERTASETTGKAAKSSFWMIGSSIPWGRIPRMALTLARTSWTTSLSFTSRWNMITTLETLSREVDMTCLTPEMGLTASSMRLLTSRSTVSGEEPGNLVTMDTTGISTSGNISMASLR